MTFLLLPRGYISAPFKMALVQLWVSYYFSLGVICESGPVLVYSHISTGLCFILVLFAFFGRQFCGVRIKSLNLHWIFYVVYAYIMWRIVILIVYNAYILFSFPYCFCLSPYYYIVKIFSLYLYIIFFICM